MILRTRYIQRQLLKSKHVPLAAPASGNQPSQFSTCSYLHAARRSPRVRVLEQQQKEKTKLYPQPLTPSQQPTSANIKWPMAILQDAEKSGTMPISLRAAIAILDDFENLGVTSGKELCSKHRVEPPILTSLARTLLRAGSADYYPIAQRLLVAASQLDDASATLIIADTSIKSKKLNMPSVSRQHLDRMVSQKHPVALFLQGRIYQEQGKISNALQMYEECTKISSKNYSGSEAVKINLSEAWRGISSMKLKQDKQGAVLALKRSALDYDDPTSYYLLARTFTPRSAKEYETYMLKAAASGETRATDALGIYYFKQSQGCMSLSSTKNSIEHTRSLIGRPAHDILVAQGLEKVPPATVSEKRKLAEDWFQIGAEINFESSQVHLAILLREAGKLSEGMNWLEKASASSTWANTVAWFRKMWELKEIDFMRIDMEKLHRREDGNQNQAIALN